MGLFPDDFLWGASSSGHQVEGGNYDQWTVWELAHAKEMAASADKRLSWIPDYKKFKAEANTPENYVSGKAIDHLHRYKEDFDILKSLGLNAFRFGIEWSRVEPEEGVWDKAAFDHYHNYINELKKRGIEPVVNLWHWTHPVWFDDKGGFGKSGNIGYFLRYVSKFAEEFKDDVRYIITINEPNVYISYAELNNVPVPPRAPRLVRLLTYWNLQKTHKYSYRILKKANPEMQIGIAHQLANDQPKNPGKILDKIMVRAASYVWGWWFLNRIKRHMDFVGFNYYFTNYYDGLKLINPKSPTNDAGWYMEPSGICEVATKAWIKYHKPVMVTENGVADAEDQYRQWWLKETIAGLMKAQQLGVNLIGYMHWSLLDNFEWAHGWWPKFGLVEVDRKNGMKRTIRPSAIWLSKQLAIFKK